MQYLENNIGANTMLFEAQLVSMFPVSGKHWDFMKDENAIPDEKVLFHAHPSHLCYAEIASTKPPPEIKTTKLLLSDVLKHGFKWDDHNLFVWIPQSMRGQNNRLCYVKGMARACLMLTICKLCLENDIDLAKVYSKLYDSMSCPTCKMYYSGTGDRKQVAFLNAHLSHRGSICEKHTVLTWVIKLQRLSSEDCGVVFNSRSSSLYLKQRAIVSGAVCCLIFR